ncbi:hypothetical protein [Candidatus Ruthturnera calyptogenae]|nr:hypothetical protein [Candidatus Ruthturnera calyptogenae]
MSSVTDGDIHLIANGMTTADWMSAISFIFMKFNYLFGCGGSVLLIN